MLKVCMVSLGCPKNQVDAEKMLALLTAGGLELTPAEAEADAIIINTCGFIESAKAEAIENILEASKYKTDGNCKALIVTGCLAERYRDDITEEIPEVDVCVGIGANSQIAEIVKKAVSGEKQNYYGEKTDLRPSDYVGTRCDFVDAICVFVGDDAHGVPLDVKRINRP